jgi:hypothetical protein
LTTRVSCDAQASRRSLLCEGKELLTVANVEAVAGADLAICSRSAEGVAPVRRLRSACVAYSLRRDGVDRVLLLVDKFDVVWW